MSSSSLTIGQTIDQLHHVLRDYIEATYHISHPALVAQRRRLLDEPGVIHQRPYLESTPRYRTGPAFRDLGLDPAVVEMFAVVSNATDEKSRLVHDPPFQHQADSVVQSVINGRSLAVTTGTGSGKTECFVLPILGKLALEAKHEPESFRRFAAVRAILLYPMNALVNDQLGRLRLLFGDRRVVSQFNEWAGRPARFARYTSRTLYPGVRDETKDQLRLSPIRDYYVRHLELASSGQPPESEDAGTLISELQLRGKWPAKPDLVAWYGNRGARWRDPTTGAFRRCVTLPDDAELLTRHEVLEAPPDILLTNYSMLEYMLMRPLERPVFERTREWLLANPDATLLLVVDEAHLYRGAAGAEVALLLRRLRARLGVPPERIQVICTSASFRDADYASSFAAQLTGKSRIDFATVTGELLFRDGAAPGEQRDAEALAAIDLARFYDAETSDGRLETILSFLRYRGVTDVHDLDQALYEALKEYPPMKHLINLTMQETRPVDSLGTAVFEGVEHTVESKALTSLIALGSLARREPSEPGLLPCRVHSFYRGLPGLWACMDPSCSELLPSETGGPTGKLYGQPRDSCRCGARVLELFTCRICGSAYARAYTDNIEVPDFLWVEGGGAFRTLAGQVEELEPLDLLLEPPVLSNVEPADYDLVTGRLNPPTLGPRIRQVYLRRDRSSGPAGDPDGDGGSATLGEFRPCGVCAQTAAYGRSSVQDHQTKGDEPFQALVAKQIQVQPPNPKPATRLAPLRGRKVLVFSDSRQTAARLAPNLQMYSTKDALRPLLVSGYRHLQEYPTVASVLSLEDTYLAVVLAARSLGVRLRPELKAGESFAEEGDVEDALAQGRLLGDADMLRLLLKFRSAAPPASLLRAISNCLSDRYYGLESLALASIVEREEYSSRIETLPDVPGLACSHEEKLMLVRAWLRHWNRVGLWLSRMPSAWWRMEVRAHSGKFSALDRLLATKDARTVFERDWLPLLRKWFTEQFAPKQHRLKGSELSLLVGGDWAYCRACRETQRPFPGRATCVNCGQATAEAIDPESNPVFIARKGYYRSSTVDSLKTPPIPPIALIAAEHTAQLNAAQMNEVFSTAEEHELLFQDVDLGRTDDGVERPAIDVLSCTTTMEVGIDIGTLSGVALRNMPPARANYQQRSGRAGRRGSAAATVIAFGSSDSHDEHYFSHPDWMIRGIVDDPSLTLDNVEIARRHVTAYLLQRYHQERLPTIRPEDQPQLFAVLGKVADFKRSSSILNNRDFAEWLRSNEAGLREDVDSWLPLEIPPDDRSQLLGNLTKATLEQINGAIADVSTETAEIRSALDATQANPTSDPIDQSRLEVRPEEGEERPVGDPASENLLDRLLYKGVLPRYAFPTDVVTFHVFDPDRSKPYRPAFRFTPSQGLPIALSQYAPGKEVWIGGSLWTSGALYSPIKGDREEAWRARRLYYECSVCHYARTVSLDEGERGELRDCDACGGSRTFGSARHWLRPPGFAHPVEKDSGTSPDDQPAISYATRAKLTAPTPAGPSQWEQLNDHVRIHSTRQHLLVTNRGPRNEGYTYCTSCGVIEPTASPVSAMRGPHRKPYPDERDRDCVDGRVSTGLVLGTDFISDVLLVSLRVAPPLILRPGLLATDVALRTLCEALTKAGCAMLELEANELQAEYRPALTPAGRLGEEAEIYLYDTLPGGAGFSRRVGRLGLAVFQEALRILESCPDNCDRSCYRCLRGYKNKFEHDLLDRHLGVSLLRYLLTDAAPVLDPDRLERSTDLLFEDLKRQSASGLVVERNKLVTVPGIGGVLAPILVTREHGVPVVVGLHSPLTLDEPSSEGLRDLREYSTALPLLLADELVVRRNLPWATSDLTSKLRRWVDADA